MPTSRKLSSKELEILDRQRAFAAARRNQHQHPPPPPQHPQHPPPPIVSKSLPPSNQRPNKKSILELLAPRTTRSINTSTNKTVTSSTRSSAKNSTVASSSSSSSSSSFKHNAQKRKKPDPDHIVDLTSSPPSKKAPSFSAKAAPAMAASTSTVAASASTSASTSKPPLKRPSTSKRPTRRKNNMVMTSTKAMLRPSNSTVEKTILASRSRVNTSIKNTHDDPTSSSTRSSSSASTSTSKKGLFSLLSKAGISQKQLERKVKVVSKENKTCFNLRNGYEANDDNNPYDDLDDTINMDHYFDHIRGWDFLSQLNAERSNHMKNSSSKKQMQQQKQEEERKKKKDCYSDTGDREQIPDRFVTRKQYQNLWTPLCLDETRAQIISDALSDLPQWTSNNGNGRGHNNNNNKRNNGNGAMCLVPVSAAPHSKDVGGKGTKMTIILRKEASEGATKGPSFMSNDLVVLARDKSTFLQASKGKLFENEKTNNTKTKKILGFIGVVEYGRKTVEGLPITVSRKFWLQLSTGKKEEQMVLLKLGCNITNMREFSALCRIGSLPLLPYLLCKKMTAAKDSFDELSEILTVREPSKDNKRALIKSMGGTAELGEGFINYAKQKFNPSQLGAISGAATEYGDGGFTLVKGPPGTGKTTTLVALLNALHIRQMNKYYDKVKSIVNVSNTKSTGAKRVALEEARKGMPRLLVCAPSNNAIDNVIRKIMEGGFVDGHGNRYNPSIVRIGSGQSDTVKNVSLETKLSGLMQEAEDLAKIQSTIAGFKAEINRIQSSIFQLKRRQFAISNASNWPLSKDWEIRCDATFDESNRVYFVNHKEKTTTYECPPPPEPDEKHFPATSMPEYRTATQQLVKLVHKFTSIKSKLDRYNLLQRASNTTGPSNKARKTFDTVKQQIETDILDSTHIVLTTLGTSGCRALESSAKFEVVVVDEAAQSVEPATLVALQLGSQHAILVGDPQQLPATIFSVSGRNTKYDRSLFQRLEEAGHEVHLLDTQYRMHPEISEFPRKIFYGGYLKDGPNVKSIEYGNPLREVLKSKCPALRPFSIFDVDSSEERGGTSLSNSTEANFALHLYNSLAKEAGHIATQSRVCIITPYSQQAALLRRTFSRALGHDYEKWVEVNTVDSFQGREANVIIFSCVRAAGSRGIGFLSDVRRMNVALTRAKHFLFVIARCESIVVNPYWDQLVKHARESRAVIPVPVNGRSLFPDLRSLEAMKPTPKAMIPITNMRKGNDSSDDEDGQITV